MDIISQLEGVPHAIEEIFLHVDTATLCESVVKVSTTWKRLITSLKIKWKRVWKKNMRMSLHWRTLSARMEQLQPKLPKSLSIRAKEYAADIMLRQEECQFPSPSP